MSIDPFTLIVLGAMSILGLGAFGLALWISRARKRKYRDEHANSRFI